jgi:hypothetical protein
VDDVKLRSSFSKPEWFPIQDRRVRRIPWGMIGPHESQAVANHAQSLFRLAERGGLSPREALDVMGGRGYSGFSWFLPEQREDYERQVQADAEELLRRVAEWESRSGALGGHADGAS